MLAPTKNRGQRIFASMRIANGSVHNHKDYEWSHSFSLRPHPPSLTSRLGQPSWSEVSKGQAYPTACYGHWLSAAWET